MYSSPLVLLIVSRTVPNESALYERDLLYVYFVHSELSNLTGAFSAPDRLHNPDSSRPTTVYSMQIPLLPHYTLRSHPIAFIGLTDISSCLCHPCNLTDSPPSHIIFPIDFPVGSHQVMVYLPQISSPHHTSLASPIPHQAAIHPMSISLLPHLHNAPSFDIPYVPVLNSANLHQVTALRRHPRYQTVTSLVAEPRISPAVHGYIEFAK